jgi:hypothetical protein
MALGATYVASVPTTAAANSTIAIPVTVQNTGDEPWNVAGPAPVLLAYHWLSAGGVELVWDGVRTGLGADVPPGGSRGVTATVQVPAQAGQYQLRFHLVKEGVAWLPQMSAGYPLDAQARYAVRFGNVPIFTYVFGTTHTLDVPLTNIGTAPWTAGGDTPIRLSYHWRDSAGRLLVWDGVRTSLPADVPSGATTTVSARVVAPAVSPVRLTIDLVREGVAWFETLGGAAVTLWTTVEGPRWSGRYDAPASASARAGETRALAITVANTGNVTWSSTGPNPVLLAYHLFDGQGRLVLWDGARTPLGGDLRPGESRALTLTYVAPAEAGTYSLNTDAVREGISWLSSYGPPAAATRLTVAP